VQKVKKYFCNKKMKVTHVAENCKKALLLSKKLRKVSSATEIREMFLLW